MNRSCVILLLQVLLFGFDLLGKRPLAHQVGEEQGESDGQQDGAGGESGLQEPQAFEHAGVAPVQDADRQEGNAHERGDAGAGELVHEFLLDAAGGLLGLEKLGVDLGPVFDGLEHDFGFLVGLMLPGADDQPDDDDRENDTNEDGD